MLSVVILQNKTLKILAMADKKRRPIMSFQSYPMLEFIDMVRGVILNMTDNIYYLTPNPTLDSLTTKVDALALFELAAKNGGPPDTKNMLEARQILEEEMLKLGMYIYITSDGDITKMLSSMFPLTAGSRASAKRPLLQLKQSDESGVVKAKCKAISKSVAYVWMIYVNEHEPENADDWKFIDVTTKVKKTFRKLEPRTKVWVKVCGVTHEGMTPWVNAVNIVVL
jgi:hypothetical protein